MKIIDIYYDKEYRLLIEKLESCMCESETRIKKDQLYKKLDRIEAALHKIYGNSYLDKTDNLKIRNNQSNIQEFN